MASSSILDLWPSCCKLGKFVLVNSELILMPALWKWIESLPHTVVSYLWLSACPWHWKACPCQLLMPGIFKVDIATLYYITLYNKVTRSILVCLNIYILNDAYVNIHLQYKQCSWGSQACSLFLHIIKMTMSLYSLLGVSYMCKLRIPGNLLKFNLVILPG